MSLRRADIESFALPLENLSGDPTKEYFGDGLAEELIHMLTRVHRLKVPAGTSSFVYKGRNTDVRRIAEDLGVAVVLNGSVRSDSDRVRLTVQLVDGCTGYQIWSQSFDREFRELFPLQDDLASTIVQVLTSTFSELLSAPTQGRRPTVDLQAYELYLRAKSLVSQPSEQNLAHALELLEGASSVTPNLYAPTHSSRPRTWPPTP